MHFYVYKCYYLCANMYLCIVKSIKLIIMEIPNVRSIYGVFIKRVESSLKRKGLQPLRFKLFKFDDSSVYQLVILPSNDFGCFCQNTIVVVSRLCDKFGYNFLIGVEKNGTEFVPYFFVNF